MKKRILCAILFLCLAMVTGCSKKEIILSVDDISTNTMLVKANGSLQVALVEDFNKPYYSLSELEEFIKAEVNKYNQSAGSEVISIDALEQRNGKAVVIISYAGMAHYAAFNDVIIAYFNTQEATDAFPLPDNFVSAKNGKSVPKEEALNNKYKVLAVNEAMDIIVYGHIKYYTDNATLVDDNKLQSSGNGMAVLIFKP